MQRVLHDGRRFWTIQLNYIREELARTDTLKAVTEAYSAHTDTHTVCKRNTVYERSIRIATDILLLLLLLLLLPLLLQVDTVISYQCLTCQNTGIIS